MDAIVIKGKASYIQYLSKHLLKEHPSTSTTMQIVKGREASSLLKRLSK